MSIGITSDSFPVVLPKNALVRRFTVIVTAARASQVKAVTAAQVRAHETANSAVIDFGVPRTVSEISVKSPSAITTVKAWNGTMFGTTVTLNGTGAKATFQSEVRSERFLVEFAAKIAKLEDELFLALPELPADLEIRINGGPPVWTHSGPALPTSSTALSTDSFNRQGRRLVELGNALGTLLGDPLSKDTARFEIKLTTRVPGELDIAEHAQTLWFVNRVLFTGDAEKVLDFPEEGQIDLDLPLPAPPRKRLIEEVRLTAIGNLPPERTMPAVGPPPVTAEMVIDSEHAACVRLRARNDADEEIDQLTAVRLPLAAEGDGAEVHVVLWEDDGDAPSAPMPGAVSKPVTLSASDAAVWIRFDFPKPVPIDRDREPWLAVLASRGTAIWALADGKRPVTLPTRDHVLVPENEVRRGGPTGPWEELPAPFQGGFLEAAGRVRVTGFGAKESPVAPLLMNLFGDWSGVTPTVKGVAVTLAASETIGPAQEGPRLTVLSRTAGSVTLRDVDVVWSPVLDIATSLTEQSHTNI